MVAKNIVIILLIVIFTLKAAELDKDLFRASNFVEFVKLSDNNSYFEYHYNDDNDDIIVPRSHNSQEFVSEINFFDTTNKNEVMGIFSLAGKDKYFNGSFYDTIKIAGMCKDCSVFISDKTLFEKEDSIKIGNFKNSIYLGNLVDKIDLRRLKYLVFFAPKKENIDIKRITFYHTKKKSKKYSSSVWIWNSKDVDIDKIKKQNIKTVYLQVDEKFKDTAIYLHKNGIDVYALDGDPSYIFDDSKLINNIERVLQTNKTNKFIKGFQIDIEPHTLKSFGLNKRDYLQKLIVLSRTIRQKLKENSLQLSIVMPFWYDTVYADKKSVAYSLIDIADEVVLMSYRTDPSEIISISADKLAYADMRSKKIKLGIELMPIQDEKHFVYQKNEIEKCSNLSHFPDNCRNVKFDEQYTVKGSSISFFSQKDKLRYLVNKNIGYNSFNGFVYHHICGL